MVLLPALRPPREFSGQCLLPGVQFHAPETWGVLDLILLDFHQTALSLASTHACISLDVIPPPSAFHPRHGQSEARRE